MFLYHGAGASLRKGQPESAVFPLITTLAFIGDRELTIIVFNSRQRIMAKP